MKLISIESCATENQYASITPDAKIRIKARKRIGTRDDDGTPIIEEWWVETDLLAYLPAWDIEDVQKARDYAVIVPQSEFCPSWWYKPWEYKNKKFTRARSSMDIHPDDYLQLKPVCGHIREQIGREFLISRHGLAWGWKDFKLK